MKNKGKPSAAAQAQRPPGPLWFWVLAALAAVALSALLWYPPLHQASFQPVESGVYFESQPDLVNINTAPAEELQLLPGIGPKLAQAIVAHRSAYGPFESKEELLQVRGLGQKTLQQLEPLICL